MCQWHDCVRLTPPFFSIANCRQVSERSWEWVPLPRLSLPAARKVSTCIVKIRKCCSSFPVRVFAVGHEVSRSVGLLVCRAVKLSVFHSLTRNTHSISKKRKQAALLSLFMNTANF